MFSGPLLARDLKRRGYNAVNNDYHLLVITSPLTKERLNE